MSEHFLYADLMRALLNPRAWIALTRRSVRLAYRRSYFGILWISSTVAITILALSAVYTYLFPVSLAEYMPFLTVSYIGWIAISNILLSGPNVFVQYSGFITQEMGLFSNYVFAVVADKLVIFANHSLVILVVLIWFQVPISFAWLILPVVLAIYFVTGVGTSFLFGLLATKYRDVNQLLVSFTQLAFFVTPVLWKPEFLSERKFIVDINPFYHYLEILRQPLLNQQIPWDSLAITTAIALLSCIVGVWSMNVWRKMIVFWV